jgi:AraC-like DNA-binding protein
MTARSNGGASATRAKSSGASTGPALNTSEGGITVATVELGSHLSAEEHARQYKLATNGLFETRMTTPDPNATLRGMFLGALHVTFGDVSPRVNRRTTALCSRDRFDSIALQWNRCGAWHGRIGGQTIAGVAGTLILLDLSRPFSFINETARSFVIVMIPRLLATRLIDDPAALHGRTIDAREGAILIGFLSGLVAHPEALRADQGLELADTLLGLTRLALRANEAPPIPAESDAWEPIRQRVGRLIDMRLHAGDLTPEWIARKLNLSRTQLYAAFQREGIAAQIWDRRLAAAQALLTDPREDRPINVIARLLGFASDAHFSRVFKRRYGVTPTACRKAART